MSSSDYESFETEFFYNLQNDTKKCLKTIDKYSKVVENYLNGENLVYTKNFLNNFNDIIVKPNNYKFKSYKEILNHKLFTSVLAEFRESDVLIKACKICNEKTIKWLFTMKINFAIQDELGMTALMHAVKHTVLDFAIKKIIKTNGKHIQFVDKNGNNALFHSAENSFTFRNFLVYKDKFNLNYTNYNNENLLLYCCRHGKIKHAHFFDLLCQTVTVKPYHENTEGKTVAMCLAERFRYNELKTFKSRYGVKPNYKSELGKTIVSCVINRYYKFYTRAILEENGFGLNNVMFKYAINTFVTLVKIGCNINEPIDEDGTTMTLILLKLRDIVSYKYLVKNGGKEYDISAVKETPQNDKYPGVDISNSRVQKNIKESQQWLKEELFCALNPMYNNSAIKLFQGTELVFDILEIVI